MLVGLDLDDLSSPSCCFSCSFAKLAGVSGLTDQSCKVFGSEVIDKSAVRECFSEITVSVRMERTRG